MSEIMFKKEGKELKEAAKNKIIELKKRLEFRNIEIEKLLDNKQKMRSYLIRVSFSEYGRGNEKNRIFGKNDISLEEVEEIRKMCQRIYEIESEINQLQLTIKHLDDKQEIYLTMDKLIEYGFDLEGVNK